MKHLTKIMDLQRDGIESIVKLAFEYKHKFDLGIRTENVLNGKMVAMVFEKPSLRTKVAFEIATEYFLKQRIKSPAAGDAAAAEKYGKQLEVLHGILVTSMKTKQTVDAEHVAKLRTLVDSLSELYFSEEQLEHLKAHQ